MSECSITIDVSFGTEKISLVAELNASVPPGITTVIGILLHQGNIGRFPEGVGIGINGTD